MTDYKSRLDVFVCGGSQHVEMLKPLLGKLRPFGTVHLGSSFLTGADLRELRGLYDVLHAPRHSPDAYYNFELFVIKDINRLASAPRFVKLDADIHVEPDWIEYVEECVAAHPDAVLFGPRRGDVDVNCEIKGPLARRLFGRELRVTNAPKVLGGFYVGLTSFFREHGPFMGVVHELNQRDDGRLLRPTGPAARGAPRKFRGNEDTLRSFVVHAAGAGDRLHVLDSGGRVRIERPDAVVRQPQWLTN